MPQAASISSIIHIGLAQHVGTATESLIRTVSDFEAEKITETVEGKIRIINLDN